MTERQAISKGEMEIARALWEIGPATVRAVFRIVAGRAENGFCHRADVSSAA